MIGKMDAPKETDTSITNNDTNFDDYIFRNIQPNDLEELKELQVPFFFFI